MPMPSHYYISNNDKDKNKALKDDEDENNKLLNSPEKENLDCTKILYSNDTNINSTMTNSCENIISSDNINCDKNEFNKK